MIIILALPSMFPRAGVSFAMMPMGNFLSDIHNVKVVVQLEWTST